MNITLHHCYCAFIFRFLSLGHCKTPPLYQQHVREVSLLVVFPFQFDTLQRYSTGTYMYTKYKAVFAINYY